MIFGHFGTSDQRVCEAGEGRQSACAHNQPSEERDACTDGQGQGSAEAA